jgi:hypothetical protein
VLGFLFGGGKMKAYKVFNNDWTCRGFQYEVGKTYTMKEKPELCSVGFHACKKAVDCFSYYPFESSNKVAEVELSGIIVGEDGDKQASNTITILRELSWHEVLDIVNTGKDNTGHSNSGNWNSGHRNSGDSNSGHSNSGHSNSGDWNSGHSNSGNSNSGDWNSGDCNSGHSNSGDWNSGDWNSGDWNSGMFNTNEPTLRLFNRDSGKLRHEISFPDWFYFDLTVFVSYDTATDEERAEYKNEIETCGGFLKTIDYKTAWKLAYEKASEDKRQSVKKLPNWDADIFEEITGIRIE